MVTIYIELENTKYAMDGGRIPYIQLLWSFGIVSLKCAKTVNFNGFWKAVED